MKGTGCSCSCRGIRFVFFAQVLTNLEHATGNLSSQRSAAGKSKSKSNRKSMSIVMSTSHVTDVIAPQESNETQVFPPKLMRRTETGASGDAQYWNSSRSPGWELSEESGKSQVQGLQPAQTSNAAAANTHCCFRNITAMKGQGDAFNIMTNASVETSEGCTPPCWRSASEYKYGNSSNAVGACMQLCKANAACKGFVVYRSGDALSAVEATGGNTSQPYCQFRNTDSRVSTVGGGVDFMLKTSNSTDVYTVQANKDKATAGFDLRPLCCSAEKLGTEAYAWLNNKGFVHDGDITRCTTRCSSSPQCAGFVTVPRNEDDGQRRSCIFLSSVDEPLENRTGYNLYMKSSTGSR